MMSLFRNRICWRLRRTGLLARYAEGAPSLAASDRAATEAHLTVCPACAAEVAELRAVAVLLRGNVPSAPAADGLAAHGELWSVLESQIARTPQDAAAPPAFSRTMGPEPPSPRLERLSHILSTPRGAPFGAAVVLGAAVVAGFVFLYHPAAELPAQVASVPAAPDSALIAITPYPILPAPAAVPHPAAVSSRSAQIHVRRVPVAAAADAATADRSALRPALASAASARPLEGLAARRRPAPAVAPPRPLLVARATEAAESENTAAVTARSSIELGPVLRAKHSHPQEHSADTAAGMAAVATATAPEPVPVPTPFAVASGAFAETAPTALPADGTGGSVDAAPASGAVAPAAASEDAARADAAVPDARATLDVALELRRQRSLFSYATR